MNHTDLFIGIVMGSSYEYWDYSLGNVYKKTMGHHHVCMGKSTISMAMASSLQTVNVYQRVCVDGYLVDGFSCVI